MSADHEWKNAFFRNCLTPVLSSIVAVQQPEYAHIVALDHTVRNFGMPVLIDEHQANPRFLDMLHGLVTMSREIGQSFSIFPACATLICRCSAPPAAPQVLHQCRERSGRICPHPPARTVCARDIPFWIKPNKRSGDSVQPAAAAQRALSALLVQLVLCSSPLLCLIVIHLCPLLTYVFR